MQEIFKDVIGYEGLYQVSNLGRVKSLDMKVWGGKSLYFKKGRFLSQNIDGIRYLRVGLCNGVNQVTKRVHQLMAESFLDHRPSETKLVCDHINNDPLDNRLENLQLISNRENSCKDKKGTSKYRGVSLDGKKWMVSIRINGKKKYLGRFTNEIEASNAYQNALNNLNK